jgi:hypothetical protein
MLAFPVFRTGTARGGPDAFATFGCLIYVLVLFIVGELARLPMAVEQDRKIIRLFNQLRRLERAGRPTANVRRQIRQAMRKRDAA